MAAGIEPIILLAENFLPVHDERKEQRLINEIMELLVTQ
jgi:hypothetical protein